MRKFWKRGAGFDIEGGLRRNRPEPRAEFLVALSDHVREAGRPTRAWSRVVFAAALTTFMLGTFASFGGVGYAASGASKVVTRIVSVSHTHATVRVRGLSAASDEYKPTTKPTVAKKVKPLQVKGALVTQKTQSGKLPFTGISLLTTIFMGLALIVLGMVLRRREAKQRA